VAKDVSSSAGPLLQASERIARATEAISNSMGTAVQSLSESQVAARELAERLSSHHREIEKAWENYQRQFGTVDESLSKAVQSLAEESTKQQESEGRTVNPDQPARMSLCAGLRKFSPAQKPIAGLVMSALDRARARPFATLSPPGGPTVTSVLTAIVGAIAFVSRLEHPDHQLIG
jgi:hypothetical protein